MIRTTFRPRRIIAGALLVTASTLALAMPAQASNAIYASDPGVGRAAAAGERVTQQGGLTQLRLDNGGTASFVDGSSYQLRPDGGIDLFAGSVTISGADGAPVVVHLADQGEGRVQGRGSAASFSVSKGEAGRRDLRGHVLNGAALIALGGNGLRRFNAGQMWRSDGGRAQLVVAIGAQAVPQGVVADMAQGGPLAAAENGVPVVLGDALAAAGASGNIIAAARRVQAAAAAPRAESFPAGDMAALVAYAGQLGGAYGGQPFQGAAADIIRSYLQFLAGGGSGAQFLTVYSGLMVQYLDLMRSGAAPSAFTGASLAQINSFITYRGRTSGFATLSGQNRVLVDAYLAFILEGGSSDQFVGRYTSLTDAYFLFLRGGGDPLAFAGASQQTINAYLAFLRDSGLVVRLSAQNQALLGVYLQNLASGGNGLAFAEQYRTALSAYYTHLQQGRLPSAYSAVDATALRGWLETLQATGLLERVLGAQAQFYTGYLAWLQGGGAADGYAALPANVFASYASALNLYWDYLKQGGVPSAYGALTQTQIRLYLAALQGAGANERFLGELASFYSGYFTFLNTGGNPDLFSGLPTPPNYPAYASALNAYASFLASGGLPSAYTGADQALLQKYIKALIDAGKLTELLGGNAALLSGYYTYVTGGGAVDRYSGLPVYAGYASALKAYYAFLAGGGLPSGYTALTAAQLQAYLKALTDAGIMGALFTGDALAFLGSYYTHVAGGGAPNQFAGLPANNTGGGGGGTVPPVTPATSATLLTPNVFIFQNGGINVLRAAEADVGPNGTITRVKVNVAQTLIYASPAVIREQGRVGDAVAWSRWDGVGAAQLPNPNVHIMTGTLATSLPTSGKVDYRLIGGTAPTDLYGSDGAAGSFTGALSVQYGAALRVGYDFDVAVGNMSWRVSTPGGAATPATGQPIDTSVMRFGSTTMTPTGLSGGACTVKCGAIVFGGLFGSGASHAGIGYSLFDNSDGKAHTVDGTAVFGTSGTALSSIGAATPSTPTPTPPTTPGIAAPTGSGLMDLASGATGSVRPTINQYNASVTALADGRLEVDPISYARNTASVVDYGTAGGVLGWSRWEGGTTNSPGANPAITYAVNGGVSNIWGKPVTNMPTSGTATYTMVGHTKPTAPEGTLTPGEVTSASLAVAFATRKVGLEANIMVGGVAHPIKTSGGLAAPSVTVLSNGTFSDTPFMGSEMAQLRGYLAGDGASHAAVAYIFPTVQNVNGVIAFAKVP